MESSEEWLLLIKSSRALFERLRAALEEAHSYEVPEVLALPVVDGAAAYLDWLQANLLADWRHRPPNSVRFDIKPAAGLNEAWP